MITLNLLSSQRKEALRMRILYAVIERLMIMLVAVTLIVTAVMTVVKIELTRTLSDVLSRQVLSKEYVAANNETKSMNEAIARLDRVQKTIAPFSPLIEDVAKRTPPGVKLRTFSFDLQTKGLGLGGDADTRETLLGYGETLRASPYFVTVDLPLSNLFQRTNVSFQLNTVIRTDRLAEPKSLEAPAL